MTDMSKESPVAKATLFVHGIMNSLVQKGLVGGMEQITPAGIAAFDQLKATGYRPSREEVRTVLRIVVPRKELGDAVNLVMGEIEGLIP